MADEINPPLIIDDSHFAYLRLQKGKLDPIAHDRQQWEARYAADLLATFNEIEPFLPRACWGMLDIGSGLGGIDILIARHYCRSLDVTTVESPNAQVQFDSRDQPFVFLLDGVDDPPEMKLHRETFSNMKVARDFLIRNGIRADRFGYYAPSAKTLAKAPDLVMSFGSWCFHYEPAVYLPLLATGLHADSVVIADVRRERAGWEIQLHDAGLDPVAIIRESEKFRRVVMWRAR
jgi:SAM-dependent methyltransferase